ncbi:MAG: hypothetical protein NC324_02645 [Bacteroides sp.]|nr:hypothetical protein [Bacteroides sp.]
MMDEIKLLEAEIAAMKRKIAEFERTILRQKSGAPLVDAIVECIERMGIERDVLFSRSSKRGQLFFARCVFAERLRRNGFTFAEIARMVKRDHATAVYYVNSYKKAVNEPRFEREFVRFIEEFDNQMKIQQND